jgi:hypothetical protein
MDAQSFLTGFDTAEAFDPADSFGEDWYGEFAEVPESFDSFAADWYGESPRRRRRVQVSRARVAGRPSRARLRRAPARALYAEPAEPEFPEPADPSEFPEPADDGDFYSDEWYGEVGDITDSNEAYFEDVDVDLGEDLDYDFDEGLSMWGESLRGALSEEIAQTASSDEVESLLDSVLESLPAGESFNFGRLLSAALPVAQAALPLAAGAAGTLVGGPVGTAIGTSVGSSLARSLSRQQPGPARAPAAPPVPPPAAPSVPPPAAPSVPPPAAPSVPPPAAPSVPTAAAPQGPVAAVQPAAMQAAAFANHPVTQQALMAAALGDLGKRTVNGVPVAAYLGALKALFGEAEQEADEHMRTSADYPAYLLDADGELRVDPAVPAERAHALYDALMNQQT